MWSPVCLGPRLLKLFHYCLWRGPSCSQICCGCPSPTSLPLHHLYPCFPIIRIFASPSPASLLPCHSHLHFPITRISATPLPASRRCSLSILHELCDSHYVTSTAPPPPPRSPSTRAPTWLPRPHPIAAWFRGRAAAALPEASTLVRGQQCGDHEVGVWGLHPCWYQDPLCGGGPSYSPEQEEDPFPVPVPDPRLRAGSSK